ncbi:MAG: hypothetical protein IPM08_06235 [Actinomycetales bacterium]|jgi:hypothetical protein|nr:hypothetical protein [Actinomycetales bacterium]HMT32109.1 hypothetical protein [Dermatophilaceae bacterium]
MSTVPTDLTRAIAAIRRRWMVVVAAVVGGLLVGLLLGSRSGAATYEAVIPTPTIDSSDLIDQVVVVRPSLDDLLAFVQGPDARASLGDQVVGSSVTGVVATDKSTITLRISAPDAGRANTAAQAYANLTAKAYSTQLLAQVAQSIKAIDDGIAILANRPAPAAGLAFDGSYKYAELVVQRRFIQEASAALTVVPQVRPISSNSSPFSTGILLAVAFGAVALAAIGLTATRDRVLRYAADVEAVPGSGPVVAVLDGRQLGWAAKVMLAEHRKGGASVAFVPSSSQPSEALRGIIDSWQGDTPVVMLSDVSSADAGVELPSAVLVVAQLGKDTADDLAGTARALAGAGIKNLGTVVLATRA